MIGILSKLFGGNKSEKDVKKIQPNVAKINEFFSQYQGLSNDQLRNKTQEFKARIKEHLAAIDEEIASKKAAAEAKAAEEAAMKKMEAMQKMYSDSMQNSKK